MPVDRNLVAPHALTLDALSRVALLLKAHRGEIPLTWVEIQWDGVVVLQLAQHGAPSSFRKHAVNVIADALFLPAPQTNDLGQYMTVGRGWQVFTKLEPAVAVI